MLKNDLTELSLIDHILVQVITQFLEMETLLDDSVDRKIELQIERGGARFTVDLMVRFTSGNHIFPSLLDTCSCLYFVQKECTLVALWICLTCSVDALQVQDLHSITPYSFLEVSDAVIHPLSYQQVGQFSCFCLVSFTC